MTHKYHCRSMVSLVTIALMVLSCHAWCPVRLPQDEPWWSVKCKVLRHERLKAKRLVYGISQGTSQMPYDRLAMTQQQYLVFLATNPFLSAHSKLWAGQAILFEAGQAAYNAEHLAKPQIMTIQEFADMRKFFRNYVSSPTNLIRGYLKYPSENEPFQSDYTEYISDKFFAEQRLAGMNPMDLQKITLSDSVGVNYDELKESLNPNFDYLKAVNQVLGDITDEDSLKNAIEDGRLFVLRYPLSDDVGTMPDRTDDDPARSMWPYMSPIAIFASKSVENCKRVLTPVAIQMDHKQDAQVFTPQDGDQWLLAKLNLQLTDLGSSQIVEHLCKVHFTIETICLNVERQLSDKHPLFDFMRFHCRGVFTANTLGGPVLLSENGSLGQIMPYGYLGANKLAQEASKIVDWNDLDLNANLKRRGVDDDVNLPYYPYRDDGKVIFEVLQEFVKEYINRFYSSDDRVLKDKEVQKFAKKTSIRGFPKSFPSKASLIETFTRILWVMVGQHTAINYPMADYASYVPNASTKLYNDTRVPDDVFSSSRLNNRNTASEQMDLVSALSSFRFDRIFDYGEQLRTSKGKDVVNYFENKMAAEIDPKLRKRNKARKEQGHLTYPYMQPSWLTNGIQS